MLPFVRLQPIQLDGGNRADVQPVNMGRVDELPLPFRVLSHGAANQRGADLFQHLFLRGIPPPSQTGT